MDWWLSIYWTTAVVVVIGAILLGVQTWEHRRYARSRVTNLGRKPPPGRTAVFVPCKGADVDFEANVRRLFEQDHDDYELVFIVESLADDACPPIRRLMARYPAQNAKLIVAGLASHCGQKVHNLLAGTRELAGDIRTLVFVDADVRPPRDWLRLLTQRLNHYGATTGYRRFSPKRATLANCLLSSIDSAVVAIMIPSVHHMVWGGSWAIRRRVFDDCRLREAWQGTLSDDLVAGRVLFQHRVRVGFEPACILNSPLDINLAQMFSFVRRQFTIGRLYSTTMWNMAVLWNCLSQSRFWGTAAVVAWGLCTAADWTWRPGSVVGLLYGIHVCRGWMRQDAARHYAGAIDGPSIVARHFDIWLGPLASLVCCGGLLVSAVGRQIVWKNIRYEIDKQGYVSSVVAEIPTHGAAADDGPALGQRRMVA
jgi:hypothetical protein